MGDPEITVVRSYAGLDALESEWNVLAARFETPLLEHDWFASAARAFHTEAELRIVTVRRQGVLTAVAPLALEPSRRHLVLIGAHALFEPSGWLFDSNDALRDLCRAIVAMGFAVICDRIAVGGEADATFAEAIRDHAMAIRRPAATSFAVAIDRSWAEYSQSLSSRTRHQLERLRARAEREHGSLEIVHLSPEPDHVAEHLALLMRLEGEGWKGRNGSALASRPDLEQFFRLYARLAAKRGRLRVSTLRAGTEPAAIELSIEAYGKTWGLKLAYDERFAGCAPALQLVHAAIRRATNAGCRAYEFLGSAEPWQERWKPERRHYELVALYPISPGAMITAIRDVSSAVAKRVAASGRLTPLLTARTPDSASTEKRL